MNLILLLVLVAEACLGLCAWLSPECLRRLAAHLLTRADVIDMARKEAPRRMQFWSLELGINDASPDSRESLEEVRAFVRH